MKALFGTIILIIAFGAASAASAQSVSVTVGMGKQKTAHKNLTVTFLKVVEDSRCPTGANCIWQGNAKIEIKLRKGKGAWKTAELNTSMGDQKIVFEGYEIKIERLTPEPTTDDKPESRAYMAKLAVRRI